MQSRLPRACCAALLGVAAVAARAQPVVPEDAGWGLTAGLQHRRLVERADDGTRLVTESGPMLALALERRWRVGQGGALRAEAGASAGRLDYDGRTQGGVPLSTRSGERDLVADLAWRPLAPGRWGEGWLVLHGLQQRRQIASTATARGLRETSALWMAGLRWSTDFEAAGWRWQPSAEARVSVRHRLRIDYGGVYDASDLQGGTRREFVLALAATQPGSPWQWSVQWTGARQSASAWQPLYGGGVPVGNVRQPRIAIDDIGVRVRRGF